jgi:phosphoribosylcarboxyaminoimidazole (NCAIR) mutase
MSKPVVGIIMGSQSDLKIMKEAAEFLEELEYPSNSQWFLRIAHPNAWPIMQTQPAAAD